MRSDCEIVSGLSIAFVMPTVVHTFHERLLQSCCKTFEHLFGSFKHQNRLSPTSRCYSTLLDRMRDPHTKWRRVMLSSSGLPAKYFGPFWQSVRQPEQSKQTSVSFRHCETLCSVFRRECRYRLRCEFSTLAPDRRCSKTQIVLSRKCAFGGGHLRYNRRQHFGGRTSQRGQTKRTSNEAKSLQSE